MKRNLPAKKSEIYTCLLLFLLLCRNRLFTTAANGFYNFVQRESEEQEDNARDGIGNSRLSVEHNQDK